MKFGELVEYNKINIILQKLCRKRGMENSYPDLFLFYEKA